MLKLECPICTYRIRGSVHAGFRCVRCHARYTPQFIRQLRRAHIRELIDRHFGAQHIEEVTTQQFIVEMPGPDLSEPEEPVEEESAFVDLADLIAHELHEEKLMPELRESAADLLNLDEQRAGSLDEEYELEMPASKNVSQQSGRATKTSRKSPGTSRGKMTKKFAAKRNSSKKTTRHRR